MHKFISLFLLSTLAANALSQKAAHRHTTLQSIRVHATTRSDSNTLKLTVVAKPSKGIRAAIHPEGKYTRAVVLYTEGKVYLIKNDSKPAQELKGSDAAKNLFEMLAITPDFYFRTNKAIFEEAIFDGYSIRLNREKTGENEARHGKLLSAQLYSETDSKVLRTVRYIEFFGKNEFDDYQPKEITFSDHENDQEGSISIYKIDYNVGIGDFVFEAPDTTGRD